MVSEIVLEFIKRINEHDVIRLAKLMSDDHTFTDAQNNTVRGKEEMVQGWYGYLDIFPDYKIEVDEFYESGNTVVMIGFAGGTYKELNPEKNQWKLPAVWKAIVEVGMIKHWQVFCDTKIPFDIIEKLKKTDKLQKTP